MGKKYSGWATMTRLHVVCEGKTEAEFVKKTLAPHLCSFNIYADARCVFTNRKLNKKGGVTCYPQVKDDISRWLKEDQNSDCFFSSMIDLYALPKSFPNYSEALKQLDPYRKIEVLENGFKQDIADQRFIPYIQLHEFEALLLSDPQQLKFEYLENMKGIQELVKMVGSQNPELINDGENTAPSKRILHEISSYDKILGASIAMYIGIEKLRKKCAHFNSWLTKLENLNA
jgi:hypothetical protein